MATLYDSYTGDSACNMYLDAGATIDYPAKDIINIFGPIYTPRVYGSQLSALELASSGNITLALNDVHALDLWNSNNTTYITSLSNNSLKFITGVGSNSTMSFSSSNFDASIYSQSNINFTACNDLSSLAMHNTAFTTSNDFTVNAFSNVTLTAVNKSLALYSHDAMSIVMDDTTDNISITAANAVNISAGGNFTSTVSSNMLASVTKSIDLVAAGSNVTAKFDNATYNFTLFASSNTSFTACNNFSGLAGNNATVEALAGDVFLAAHNQAVTLELDAATDSIIGLAAKNVTFAAGCNASMSASNDVSLDAVNGSFAATAGLDLSLDAVDGSFIATAGANASVTAASNLSLTATAGALSNVAGTSVATTAGANISSTAASNIFSTATAGSMSNVAGASIASTAAMSITSTATAGSVTTIAGSSISDTAASNISSTATSGSVTTIAGANIVSTAASNFTATATAGAMSNIAGTDFVVLAGNDASVSASNDMALTSGTSFSNVAGGSYAVTAAQSVATTATAGSVTTIAGSSIVSTAASNVTTTATAGAMSNIAGTDFVVLAGAAASVSASNNLSLTSATGSLLQTAASNVTLTATNGSLSNIAGANVSTVAATNITSTATAGSVTTTAGSSVTTTAASNVTTTATAGSLSNVAGTDVSTVAGNNLVSTAGNTATITSASNMTLTSTAGSFTATSQTGMFLTSQSNVSISANGNGMSMVMDPTTSNIFLTAPNGVNINGTLIGGTGGNSTQNNPYGYTFNVNNSNVFSMDSTGATLHGNLMVQGMIDTINIHETELWIQDKLINLATESNGAIVLDGAANDGGGMRVYGVPASDSNADPNTAKYMKSLLWHNSTNGVVALGGPKANVQTESFWEMKGGHFRLSHTKTNTGKYVSFALRVNDADECEMVKITCADSNASPVFKVIAKFGQTGSVV
jgi:hypothetical protein